MTIAVRMSLAPFVLILLLLASWSPAGDAPTPAPASEKKPDKSSPAEHKAARQKMLREALLDHFVIGVEAPKEWHAEVRQQNGARFEFSNVYLSTGVGHGEDPWFFKYSNFVENRVLECKSLGMGAWFTWYMLSQSKNKDGLTYEGTGPAKTAPANAKDPALMRAYFEMFRRMLVECAKHPEVPIVVQIEPDEWCHLLLSGGLDPTKVDVKVGSCGMDELKGLPDNEIGYAQALARLRDQYAPMTMLATNPSGWDWQNSMSGAKMGAAFKQMCGTDYELAAFEFSDRDKGAPGSDKKPPYGEASGICATFPNHLKWISEFHEATGLWVCMWQVAIGNTYYATCDNSTGHYCDNLAQFILEGYPKNDGIAKYVAAGCCGWMFNSGQGGTQVYDARKDGITNPTPIAGGEGKKSLYPDDDGGFMRVMGGAYYKHPYPILGKKGKPGGDAGEGDPAETADKPARAATLADKDAPKLYGDKLRARIEEELAAKRTIAFAYAALKSKVRIDSLTAGVMKVKLEDGGEFELPWQMLQKSDLLQLALIQVRETKPEDNAIAAFFLLLDGQVDKADEQLRRAIGCDEPVRKAFTIK